MIKLKIDGKEIEIAEGTTVIQAAKALGIQIPTMCYLEGAGFHNHPSCMLCLVKDGNSGRLKPSCALPAADGMDIITNDEEIKNARKDALELLMSDHVGDCEAPCTLGCPASMNIPLMNRLIAKGEYAEALKVVKEDIAIPHILGYICPAPCEKVCRRNSVDTPVQICQLKKFVAAEDSNGSDVYYPENQKKSGKKVAIVGSGPAGLSSAFYLLRAGHECVIYDQNEKAGGALRYEKMKKQLPVEVLDSEVEYLKRYGAELRLNTKLENSTIQDLRKNFDAIVLATGSNHKSKLTIDDLETTDRGIKINPNTYESSISGIFALGSAVKSLSMAIRSAAQGKEVAASVHQFLAGEEFFKPLRMFNSKFGKLTEDEVQEYLKEAPNKEIQHKTFEELNPYQHEAAMDEANRCMHCDCRKIDNCSLRIHSDTYDVDRRKYLLGERQQLQKYFKQDVIVYEPEKCIKCGLCVEITATKKEKFGLTFIGRGFDVKIKAPFDKSMNEALTSTAIECAKACPTGAISLIE